MANILALTNLYDAVVALFAAEGTAVPNLFGWRESGKQLTTGNRIVWYPGDPQGDMGEIAAASFPGRNPRPLGTLKELFTVEISASDQSSPAIAELERAQYQVCRELYDAWYRAVYLSAYGTFEIQSQEWVVEKKERRYGATIRVVCAIEAMLPDAQFDAAPTDTKARIDVTELDVTEQWDVDATTTEPS